MVLYTCLFSLREVSETPKPVLCDFGQFKQDFLNHVFFIGFAVKVNIQLHSDFPVLEDPCQGLKDEIDKLESWLFVFQNFDDILFEEILYLIEAIK